MYCKRNMGGVPEIFAIFSNHLSWYRKLKDNKCACYAHLDSIPILLQGIMRGNLIQYLKSHHFCKTLLKP